MQEPAEKLLKVQQYKTKQLNYINVHEATCPEANRFHRFHVLPVLICSREMKTMYHLYSLLGQTHCFSMRFGVAKFDYWLRQTTE